MQPYEWSAGLSVGHIGIDNQHRRLFTIVNDLHGKVWQSDEACEKDLRENIAELLEYARIHFGEEEKLMEASGYPGFPGHKQQHDRLAVALKELEKRLHRGETREVAEILPALMGEWLTHHIAVEDQLYARFVTPYVANRAIHEGSDFPEDSSLEERLLHLGRIQP